MPYRFSMLAVSIFGLTLSADLGRAAPPIRPVPHVPNVPMHMPQVPTPVPQIPMHVPPVPPHMPKPVHVPQTPTSPGINTGPKMPFTHHHHHHHDPKDPKGPKDPKQPWYTDMLEDYYRSLYQYDRAVLRLEKGIWKYDLQHGINPFAANLPYMYNPYNMYNPYSATPYAYNSYAYNPAANQTPSTGSGAYGIPYGSSGYGSPYAMGIYGAGGYGVGTNGVAGYGGSSYASPGPYSSASNYGSAPAAGTGDAAPAKEKSPSPLTAYGIPNDDGAVKWPLAFRLMSPEQQKDQLQKIETQLQLITTQAVINRANPNLVRETGKSVDRLRQWLRDRRADMAEGTFRDGEAFLRKLDDALQSLRS